MAKESTCNAREVGNLGLIPGLGRSPGGGNDYPLQFSCLENPMDRGDWRATVHKAAKHRTRLNNWTHTYYHHPISNSKQCQGQTLILDRVDQASLPGRHSSRSPTANGGQEGEVLKSGTLLRIPSLTFASPVNLASYFTSLSLSSLYCKRFV